MNLFREFFSAFLTVFARRRKVNSLARVAESGPRWSRSAVLRSCRGSGKDSFERDLIRFANQRAGFPAGFIRLGIQFKSDNFRGNHPTCIC